MVSRTPRRPSGRPPPSSKPRPASAPSRSRWAGRRTVVASWLAGLDGHALTVEVPASSANLGAGYDCLGVALAMVNRGAVEVRAWSRGAIELTVDGEGHAELSEDRQNRFVRGL